MATTSGGPSVPTAEELAEQAEQANEFVRVLLTVAETPVGQSPKEVVWRRNKAQLYHYLPKADLRHATPILIVYALINKPYILDLSPGASLVEYLVGRGFEVYMLDWGTPGDEDRGMRFEDYVDTYIPRAAQRVLRHSGAESFSPMT